MFAVVMVSSRTVIANGSGVRAGDTSDSRKPHADSSRLALENVFSRVVPVEIGLEGRDQAAFEDVAPRARLATSPRSRS
jgi:hypothetical protein